MGNWVVSDHLVINLDFIPIKKLVNLKERPQSSFKLSIPMRYPPLPNLGFWIPSTYLPRWVLMGWIPHLLPY